MYLEALSTLRTHAAAADCDANKVCDVNCAEIDLIEANKHALHTTAHTPFDGGGKGGGLGGGLRQFSKADYDPGASTIDTTKPFTVATAFEGGGVQLTGLSVTLEQEGRKLSYKAADAGYLGALSGAVAAGMTPVLSYW